MEEFKWILIVGGIITLGFIIAMYHQDTQQTERYKICLDAMIKAIPDPNDDGRAAMLKDCVQK